MKVYLDNGASTKVDPKVVEEMLPFFSEKYGNASSLHGFGSEAKYVLEDARKRIAKTINAEPEEIIFTSGGTESDNIALKGIAFANEDKGRHIITTKIEHPAVLNTCKTLEKYGFDVTYTGVDGMGLIDLKELESSITDKTVLVSIMHANNEIGVIQDIESIGEICKDKGVLFHSDAVQSFTKVPIDVKKFKVDLLSLSGHKIHGPKGIGALFVRKGTKLWSIISGGHQESDKRPGTENISGLVGFAKAAESVGDKDLHRMKKLRDKMIAEIENRIPDVVLNGSRDKRLVNNVNISFKFIEGESLLLHLDNKGIAVSTGSACSSQSLEPSHVLLAIGMKPEVAHGSIRFTLSKFTTEAEIDYCIDKLEEIVKILREMSPLK